ncbi:hypothetical protein DPMN_004118 [Dreissena polymorpha]|uniref:L-Fucosyltransferase n=1 Tax=Dreissena polymorpha TaxID=45954 RepID=A0A9D4MPP3_DREPO|nr:hypothetical protein DPMN_004118 [Dreissena polymorpha]
MQKRYPIRWMILGIMIFAIVQMFAYRHFKLNTVVPDGRHGGKADIVTTRNSSSQSSDILNNRHNEKFSLELKGQQSKLITVVPDNLLREKVDIVTKSNFSSQSSDISNNRHTGTFSFELNSQQSTLNIIVPDHLHGGKVDIVPTSNSSSQSSDIPSNRHNGTLGFELKRQQSSHNTVVPPLRLGGKEDIVTASNSSAHSSNISNIRNNGKMKRQQSKLNTVVSDFLPEGKIDIVTTSNSLAQSSHITNIRHNGTLSLRLIGRLGNQMFQYASILGLADMLKFTHIVLEGGQDLQSSFQLSDNRVKFTRISTERRIIGENVCCAFDKRLTKFNNTEDVHVIGYLLSWTYFHNIEKHIRKEFAFSLGISSEAKRIKLDIA